MKKTVKYFFEAFFVYLSFLFAKIIGLTLSRKLFSFLFKRIGPFIRSNDIIEKNLNNLPNQYTEQKKNMIKDNMWSNYGMTFIEYIFLKNFKNSKTHIDIKGGKILDQILLSKTPVIFVSGHFANFELMSMEITKKKISLATIYRPLNNFFLNPFMEYLRKKYVCENQIKKGLSGVKESIKYISENNSIALMIDQRVSEGNKIKFFKQDALTTTLPAQLSLKFNLNIVPIFIERKNETAFIMTVYEPLKPSNFKDKFKFSLKLSQVLEDMILKNPNQWIWTHDRWK
ncbi:MAG: lysophospholipid acyltransferase family protein [Candidatus Pelagibacter sp.]